MGRAVGGESEADSFQHGREQGALGAIARLRSDFLVIETCEQGRVFFWSVDAGEQGVQTGEDRAEVVEPGGEQQVAMGPAGGGRSEIEQRQIMADEVA